MHVAASSARWLIKIAEARACDIEGIKRGVVEVME